jgi:hypothetical protein
MLVGCASCARRRPSQVSRFARPGWGRRGAHNPADSVDVDVAVLAFHTRGRIAPDGGSGITRRGSDESTTVVGMARNGVERSSFREHALVASTTG